MLPTDAKVVSRFRGLNIYANSPLIPPDYARALLNVFINASGNLSKMRLPARLTESVAALTNGPSRYYDFQQAIGTRHILGFQANDVFLWNIVAGYTYAIINTDVLNNALWDIVTSNNIAFAANGNLMKKWTGAAWWNWGITAPTVAPTWVAAAGGVTLTTGRKWKYSYKNSVTQDESSLSPASTDTGPQAAQQFTLTPTAPGDVQVDTICWYATLDGGGDYYFESEEPLGGYIDNLPDASIDLARRGSLINEPPLTGKYLCKWNGRIFIAGLNGFGQDIIYSGYERINVGRPETSFPPYNRLRLATGADKLSGFGVIQAGVVAFDRSNKMYMFRGIVEDITTSAPLLFSAFLEELPWKKGAYSHYSIDSSPYGLVWLASDKTVCLYNGTNRPYDLSTSVYPLLRRITEGTEAVVRGAYFSWLDRDWYILSIAVDGAQQNNRLLFFDLNPNVDTNAGCFVAEFQADDVRVIEDVNGKRQLTISRDGQVLNCQVEGDTEEGITLKAIPATEGQLPAYWQGGWYGGEAPQVIKAFRYGRLITDAGGFRMLTEVVDYEEHTFKLPLQVAPSLRPSGKFSINKKGRLASHTIVFPTLDASANVQQLINYAVAVGTR